MIAIDYEQISLSQDEQLKQKTAVKQIQEILDRLETKTRYLTLSPNHRQTLLQEGYARDLVDNLVYCTQRVFHQGLEDQRAEDTIVKGFTSAAFDPSLYACNTIREHLKKLSHGKCMYCETDLTASDGGKVCHYRPVSTLSQSGITERSPYFLLAYTQSNLLYLCNGCSNHKKDHFPVLQQRYPATPIDSEQALLINPYREDTRQFIRFNPITAAAYPFDLVYAFYQQHPDLYQGNIEDYLSEHPEAIPQTLSQTNPQSNPQTTANQSSLVDSKLQQQFDAWQKAQQSLPLKGQTTIATLGLNRSELLQSRLKALREFFALYLQHQGESFDSLLTDTDYQSLKIDALKSWQQTVDNPLKGQTWWAGHYAKPQCAAPEPSGALTPYTPEWLTSSLMYLVLENELAIENKRRLVSLTASDFLYGSHNNMKTVFLSIDWEKDYHNVIKIRSKNTIWESSFAELAFSRPLEIMGLFAHNEVWVEGNYPALA